MRKKMIIPIKIELSFPLKLKFNKKFYPLKEDLKFNALISEFSLPKMNSKFRKLRNKT